MNSESTVPRIVHDLSQETIPISPNGEHWSLPGHGNAYDTCGTFGLKGCEEAQLHNGKGIFVKKFRCSCGRAECPVCYESWSIVEAHRAMERFEHGEKQLGVRALVKNIKHVMLSPDPSKHKWSLKRLRANMYRAAKAAGFKGGISIFHPFRLHCTTCGLDDGPCRCKSRRGEWYWSPHFHLLGHGWILDAEGIFQFGGWVVKNLGLRKSVYGTLRYQLSHAGIMMKAVKEEVKEDLTWMLGPERDEPERILPLEKGKLLSITWFGQVAYTKLHVVRESYTDTCPECGRKLEILLSVTTPDLPPNITLGEGWWISQEEFIHRYREYENQITDDELELSLNRDEPDFVEPTYY